MGISRGVNKVILIGNVGKDPDIKRLDNGTVIANFSLATSETYKNRDNEKVKSTEWHNIVFFQSPAEIIEKYVKKGDALYIEGRIRTRSWDDKDGNKKYMTEIVGNNIQMLGSSGKNDSQSTSKVQEESGATQESIPDEGDDLPF